MFSFSKRILILIKHQDIPKTYKQSSYVTLSPIEDFLKNTGKKITLQIKYFHSLAGSKHFKYALVIVVLKNKHDFGLVNRNFILHCSYVMQPGGVLTLHINAPVKCSFLTRFINYFVLE
jgi:hypothetical protein